MKEKKWKICMGGVIIHNEKILIVKRTDEDEDMAGCWEFPSGNASEGEYLIRELKRELLEEIGIEIEEKNIKIVGISQYNSEKKDYIKCSVQLNYLVNLKEMPQIKLSHEHVAYDWVDKNDERLDDFLKDIISQI